MNRVRPALCVFAFAVAALVAVAGCHKTPPPQAATPPSAGASTTTPPSPGAAPAAPPPPPGIVAPPASTAAPRALTEEEIFARKSVDDLNAERPLQDVFFDLDQS